MASVQVSLSPATVIGSPGCFGRVAEWQTRWLQVPVSSGTWGFKSPFAHNARFSGTASTLVTISKEVVTFVFVGSVCWGLAGQATTRLALCSPSPP